MKTLPARGMLLGLSALLLVAFGATARSDEKAPLKAASPSERVSGVIVKVEPIKKGADAGSPGAKDARPVSQRLTINTAAVWRDWARDQSGATPDRSARADAKKGDNSVATKGEPVDKDTTAVVDLGPDSAVMTRFRALDDESSKGVKGDAKAPEFTRSNLKPGLFVEVDFKHTTGQNVAKTVAVIRPLAAPKAK